MIDESPSRVDEWLARVGRRRWVRRLVSGAILLVLWSDMSRAGIWPFDALPGPLSVVERLRDSAPVEAQELPGPR